jgi:hypothetical protein
MAHRSNQNFRVARLRAEDRKHHDPGKNDDGSNADKNFFQCSCSLAMGYAIPPAAVPANWPDWPRGDLTFTLLWAAPAEAPGLSPGKAARRGGR